jgi:hypothetical protein
MSRRALALGVVDRLRSAFGDTDGLYVFKSDDLRPAAGDCSFRTGPFVVTVGRVSASRGPTQSGDVNDQVYTLQVCVTAWMGFSPWDRQGSETAGDTDQSEFAQDPVEMTEDGLEDVVEAIVTYLEEDWDTIVAVNANISGAGVTTNGFMEPFHQHSVGDIEDAPNKWVHADGSDDAGTIKKLVVTMSGARRIRVRGTR